MNRIVWALMSLSLFCISCVDEISSIDRDTLPTLTISDQGSTEGEDIVFVISLSKSSEEDVDFFWSTITEGSATEGVDYNEANGSGTIEAGSLSTSIRVPTISDGDDEVNETFTLRIFNITNTLSSQASAIATIIDDDTPDISINDASGAEGSVITFTATLNRISAKNVTFEWTTSDISTTANSDYVPLISVPATIPAGSLSTSITVTAIADAFDDTNNGETFNVQLGNVVNATVVDGIGLGTISDSDFPQVSVNDIVVVENNTASFSVSADIASERDITVNWTTADGTGSAPADYVSASGTATIPAGSLATTVNVSTFNNSSYESNETFFINLSAPVNAAILDSQGVATITDDDAPPTLAIDSLSFVEGSLFSFTVTLTGSTEVNAEFDWATSNGTANAPGDYTAASATSVVIPAGNTTATINITSLEDAIDEGVQTFNVTLSNPINSTITTAVGVGSILDNDAPPNLSINDQSVTEGGLATFTVTLSFTSEADISFDIATSDSTAVAGSDYTANSQSLMINAGSTTQTFTVTTTDDAVPCEGGETVNVNITNAPDANVTDGLGVLTITDNDPTLSINDVTIAENGGNAVFTITPSQICAGQNIDVDWATADNVATTPGDYSASSGTATIIAGNPNVTVSVPLTNDAVSELSESFFVNLTNPINAVILDAQGLGTITDEDTVPNISITDDTVTEGTAATLTVSLDSAAGSDITIDYTTVAGTAVPTNDYTTTSGTLTIPAGSLSQTITVPTINDTTEEANKTFSVQLSNANLGAFVDNTGVVTLNDNDAVPTLSINDVGIAEGGNLSFTVSLSHPSESTVSFDWTTSDGTAVSPTHYTAGSGSAETIAAGNTTATVTVATIDNATDGNNRNMNVIISIPVNATIVDNTGIGTITDNDPLPTLSVNDVSITEGGTLTFTVTQNASSELNTGFNWATSDGSAINPGDYTANSGTESITAGGLSTTFNVVTVDDAAYEADETITITLSAPTNATIADGTGVGTITENEVPPTLSISDSSVTESGSFSFTVSLSFNADVAVSVDYASTNGSAIAGSDFPAQTNTLVIPPATASGNITFSPTDDNNSESDETFTLTLSNPVNASIAVATATGTIQDNDALRLTSGLTGAEDVISMKVANDSSRVIYLADEDSDGDNELYSVATDGSGLVKISGTLPAGGDVTSYEITPDSSKVIFIADAGTDEVFEIYSVNLNGTGLANLTGALISGGDVTDFAILPNSSQVIFRADKTTDEVFELFSVAITGGAVTTLNTALVGGGDVSSFDVSGDSSKVVFIADADTDEIFELFSVNPNGTGEAKINDALIAAGDVTSFEISPDSTRVAFVADKNTDDDFELFADAIAGGTDDQLSGALVAGGDVQSFNWSPNSTKVVYLADEDSDDDVELYSVNTGGTGQVKLNAALPVNGDIAEFQISNDSLQVVYRGDANTDDIVEITSVPIGGGAQTTLNSALASGQNVTSFAISGDSSKVVYLSDETTDNEFELRSVNLNGTGNTLLSGALVAGGDISQFLISPDSSKVAFIGDRETDFTEELYSVAITGGGITKVSSNLVASGNVESDLVSLPTSSSILFRSDFESDEVTELLIHNY